MDPANEVCQYTIIVGRITYEPRRFGRKTVRENNRARARPTSRTAKRTCDRTHRGIEYPIDLLLFYIGYHSRTENVVSSRTTAI